MIKDEGDKMNRLVSFKTSKTTMYINVDHIVTMNKLDEVLTDDGEDPCEYGITLVNDRKVAIPTECFEKICKILGCDL